MGTFYWPMEIGPLDGSRYETVDALVDTGATFSQIPGRLLLELGIQPARSVESQLADGSIVQDRVGDLRIWIDGREATSIVMFGEDDSPILMGSYALTGVVLAVESHNNRLVDLRVAR